MAFLIRRVFVRAAGGGEQGFGCGGVVRLQFLFQVQCVLVGGVEKELNHRLCVCVCVFARDWVEYCCLLHYHRLLPLPLTSYSSYSRGEWRREEGGRKPLGGRMNESLNEVYCVSGCASSSQASENVNVLCLHFSG